ncbi:unnamed protein product [Auanema sp. JU1783]|nr:unnamed protein product [Auanema sp. JU1783]
MVAQRKHVYIPIFLYSITASMFMPVMQSFLFAKVCHFQLDSNGTSLNCTNKEASKNVTVHKETNMIFLFASVAICLTAMASSGLIGRVSDKRSRKKALLIPFVGLILSDVTLIVQVYFDQISPYFLIVSEFIFGCFGGYIAIFTSAFAFLSAFKSTDEVRSKSIARMEGLIGLGGMVGFMISSQIAKITYFYGCIIFFCIHFLCLLYISFVTEDIETESSKEAEILTDQEVAPIISDSRRRWVVKLVYVCFACSFFAFIGSTHILFFYLKSRFDWDAEQYSYLRVGIQFSSTFMALVAYPWLKGKGIKDTTLSIVGLLARALSKLWIGVVPNASLMITCVFFEMFSRFPATALRSLIAANVDAHERGSAFAIVGTIEAFCNLLAALVFHTLFPFSLSFFPQLSFIVMAVLIIPPTFLLM